MLADWPQKDDAVPLVTSPEDVSNFSAIQALTGRVRNARAEYGVEQQKQIGAVIVATGALREEIANEIASLVLLAKLDPNDVVVHETGSDGAVAAGAVESVRLVVQDGVEAILPLSTLIDPEKERARLRKQSDKLEKEIRKLAGRLGSKGFLDKAPEAVVAKVRSELEELEDQLSKVKESMEALS